MVYAELIIFIMPGVGLNFNAHPPHMEQHKGQSVRLGLLQQVFRGHGYVFDQPPRQG